MFSSVGISLLFLIFVICCQCFPPDEALSRHKRVVGGSKYQRGDYPFHVSLWYMGDNNPYTVDTPNLHHTCGGSLIGDSWVLTSATCFDDNFLPGLGNFSLWKVYLGMDKQTNAENEAQLRSVQSLFTVPQFNLSLSYGDVALAKLDTPADLSQYVSTIGFNMDDGCPVINQSVNVIGWGQIQNHTYGLGSDEPYVGTVKISDVKECHDLYTSPKIKSLFGAVRIDERNICAGLPEGGVDACYGDLGSPLLGTCGPDDTQVIVAIVSYGFGCARPGFPAVYGRVSSYSDWITEIINNN